MRRGDEVVLAFFIQAGLGGVIRHHAAHHGKVGRRECEGLMDGGRRRKRHAERYDRSAEATKGVTLSPVITFRDQRMTATRLFDDAGVERRGVIGAQQPQRRRAIDRQVQQRFMPLAFGQLIGIPLRVDGLADAAQPASVFTLPIDERLPPRNDPCGIRTNLGHVSEFHRTRVGPQLGAQGLELRGAGDN